MAKKKIIFQTKGMNKDTSVSKFNPEFCYENMNMRLSTNDNNTLLSWVNERGTTQFSFHICINSWENTDFKYESNIHGIPIGVAVMGSQLILFTTKRGTAEGDKEASKVSRKMYDYIYALTYTGSITLEGRLLYSGDLGFSPQYPLETLISYESDKVKKVYWTDGHNQPRFINIAADTNTVARWNQYDSYNSYFDFVPELHLKERIYVKKLLGTNGSFVPGVIQYAFTYYNKYGQESNIFYTTPLYYISYTDRGASPEDTRVGNAFQITMSYLDYDYFDYIRIYSIQRTSLNDTPIVKRLQDISLEGMVYLGQSITYTDTGNNGDSIDPTELLYKGGEEISAQTMEQKDNTLFLGNIKISRPFIINNSINGTKITPSISTGTRTIFPKVISQSSNGYSYSSQLTSTDGSETVPCGYFKAGDTYRLGVQFQYKTGKWSNPCFIEDTDKLSIRPSNSNASLTLPIYKGTFTKDAANALYTAGYRKARAVVVFPSMQDRKTLCQGIVCPTLYTNSHRTTDRDLFCQSSWFFRTVKNSTEVDGISGAVSPFTGANNSLLPYTSNAISTYKPNNVPSIRQVEVQGEFMDSDLSIGDNNKFRLDTSYLTFHSPDIDFDSYLSMSDFNDTGWRQVGKTTILNTLSDIDIQTETPVISSQGNGFLHKSFSGSHMLGIVSGLFYDDYIVDDWGDGTIEKVEIERSPVKWMVYLWNKEGSLNNDINRPSDKGTQTSRLKKKVISNLRYGDTTTFEDGSSSRFIYSPQLFSSDEPTILKLDSNDLYMGNIDTLLSPCESDGMYMAFNGSDISKSNVSTPFNHAINLKTFSKSDTEGDSQGLWKFDSSWSYVGGHMNMGNQYIELAMKKESVRIKYKSSPHLIGYFPNLWAANTDSDTIPVVEIVRNSISNPFNGNNQDSLKASVWIPCGKPISLQPNESQYVFDYSYGDTYYQRWDCLKTYPYTREDINQVVEIGSFMLETHVNIDGRYDRNRGQINNLNMSPVNFNLLNPVYSQIDNFFTYRILDEDDYNNLSYPNQLTWSMTKQSGADIDLWTNITLANVLELDGDKGKISKLTRFNDQLIAFQDTGIAQILYNENTQISTTDGVPIEIANSGKVQGKRYLSDTIGCSNKWSVATTPSGIYFIDNHDRSIFKFDGQLHNISSSKGFNTWAKKNIPSPENKWTPYGDESFSDFVTYYDKQNQDVLFICKNTALAYSEKMDAFTSFYSYGGIPYLANIVNAGLWIKGSESSGTYTANSWCDIYGHNMGEYCKFFGTPKPYWMILVGNPEPQTSKVFTNLEFRATIDGDGTFENNEFTPYLPFDYLETWDEYQHGYTSLANLKGNALTQHYEGDTSSLKRKFRIWRCDIPRDNALPDKDRRDNTAYNYSKDADLNISRLVRKPLDRMRNPWLYLKLQKNAGDSMDRVEIHDIVMTCFN